MLHIQYYRNNPYLEIFPNFFFYCLFAYELFAFCCSKYKSASKRKERLFVSLHSCQTFFVMAVKEDDIYTFGEMWNKIRPEDVLNDNNINVQRTEKER